MGALQPAHLILVLALVLIVFGPGKLPQLGKSLGDGIREFRRGTDSEAAGEPAPIDTAAPRTVETTVVSSTTSTNADADAACATCQSPVPAHARFCGSCGAAQAA